MPPLAVPSSLVSTTPVMSTTSLNTRACMSPFCPGVASITSSTSSTGVFFSTTRLTLPSSSMSPALVCRRPAVSPRTASTPVSTPRGDEHARELAGRGGLSGAVDTDDEQDRRRALVRQRPCRPVVFGVQVVDEGLPEQVPHLALRADLLGGDVLPEPVDHLLGHRGPE